MHNFPVLILGVYFENLDSEEAAQKILQLTDRADGINRYVCTVNVDFMVKVHAINWNISRDPELLQIYRKSHLATCDGKPLLWLSALLGSPMKERVTGIDLTLRLAVLLGEASKSVFLLGSSERSNKITGLMLETCHPELSIAGQDYPEVHTEGEGIIDSGLLDRLLAQEINASSPNLLLIAFGNPKQEKWFDRVRHKLKVPVSMGVGGTFELISGSYARAPLWMQKIGLEWVFRLLQDPKKLAGRYFNDCWKALGIAIPLVLYHSFSRFLIKISRHQQPSAEDLAPSLAPLLFLSPTQTIITVPLPRVIDKEYSHNVHNGLDLTINQDMILLDFEHVEHITLEGLALLWKIFKRTERSGKLVQCLNISRHIRWLLKLHRAWDLLEMYVKKTPKEALAALTGNHSQHQFFESIQQTKNQVILYFFGALGAQQNAEAYLHKLLPLLRGKICLLDFRYCTHIENAGFIFLLKLKRAVEALSQPLFLRKRNRPITRMFRLNGLEKTFKTLP